MIKNERSPVPPASLAVESQKKNGSYRCDDVISQLEHDFYGKCYLCEMKPVFDMEVEHRLPHCNRSFVERVFDWHNLFLSCRHCNLVKNANAYNAGIIDCCVRDPETLLIQKLEENKVKVDVTVPNDDEAVRTAKLIEEIFNTTSTGIRTYGAKARIEELQLTMNAFYSAVERLKKDPYNKILNLKLKALLSKSSKFSGFTRAYARLNKICSVLEDY